MVQYTEDVCTVHSDDIGLVHVPNVMTFGTDERSTVKTDTNTLKDRPTFVKD